ncbi:hypothetical protein ABPG75_000681 [Micractinium tetrahymenae]
MNRAAAALTALLLACLAALRQCTAQELQFQPGDPLQPLLPQLQTRTSVHTAWELLQALNSSAGSTVSQLITLTDDIYLRAADLAAIQPWLPLSGGNRTLVLAGAKPGANQTVLDFGGAVGLLVHPAGHEFICHNLQLQGMAPASSGMSAGLQAEMVGAYLWPTTTGEPGHLMAFWGTALRKKKQDCGGRHAEFSLEALQHLAGSNDTICMLGDAGDTIFVGQALNGSYALRNLTTGDLAGYIRYSWFNTTLQCAVDPRMSGSATPASVADLAPRQTAPTGIAGTPDQLLALLSNPNVSHIVLGAHLSLEEAHLASLSLPITLANRTLELASVDGEVKVLDLGAIPRLLFLSSSSQLTFQGVYLQGICPQSVVLPTAETAILESPLWPTIDGAAGHSVLLVDSAVHTVVSPCSRNATALLVQRLRQTVGTDGVQPLGATGFALLPRSSGQLPITDAATALQVGLCTMTVQNVIFQCEEDTSISLAAELGAGQSRAAAPADPAAVPAGGSAHQPWAALAASIAASAGAALAAAGGLLLCRKKRAARRAAAEAANTADKPSESSSIASSGDGSAKPAAELAPLTPRGARLDRMESAEPLGEEILAASTASSSETLAAAAGPSSEASAASVGISQSHGRPPEAGAEPLPRADSPEPEGWCLWRKRFGLIEGLEVAELLGRGGYGRVYKGRWNGAVVAVKVVEHRVSGGDPSSTLSREPLLCMSVSHPNCITTYKLSVIRLLRGEDLLPAEEAEAVDAAVDSSTRPRMLRSLLSGAEAVEVEDPYGPLQPGLYETWIVSEFCERGTLADALANKMLLLPDGRPKMIPVYLCLLDIAAGMQYLHSLGIMHSDLKPANVLLKGTRNSVRGFSCKLADFGLSRMLDGRATHVETGSYGTPTHAAPELLREGRLSPAVDVFAFGVLAWELVAGEEAYHGWHPMQIIMQVTQQGARPPALPHCPPALAALMQRCWRDDPAERPPFSDILADLQAQLQAARQAAQQKQQKQQAAHMADPSATPVRDSVNSLPTSEPASQLGPQHSLQPNQLSRQASSAPLLLPAAPSGGLPELPPAH